MKYSHLWKRFVIYPHSLSVECLLWLSCIFGLFGQESIRLSSTLSSEVNYYYYSIAAELFSTLVLYLYLYCSHSVRYLYRCSSFNHFPCQSSLMNNAPHIDVMVSDIPYSLINLSNKLHEWDWYISDYETFFTWMKLSWINYNIQWFGWCDVFLLFWCQMDFMGGFSVNQ